VRHLRNGVAHGNRFNITNDGKKHLAKFPAHNRNAKVRVPNADFKIIEERTANHPSPQVPRKQRGCCEPENHISTAITKGAP
jgi:hypothetical protein